MTMTELESDFIDILLVEDDPGDVRLTREALRRNPVHSRLHVVGDGGEALAFLRREGKYADAPRPDLILLDLNMPKVDGRRVLEVVKTDDDLKQIPVVVLTTSSAERDIAEAYELHANCYVTKPMDLERFMQVIGAVEGFWFGVAKLPKKS